jgi:putative membrane protein
MKKYVLIAVTALLFLSCDKNDDNDVNNTDRDFTMKASMGNTAEVDAGQSASVKGTDAGVRMFGQMMVTDHTDAETQLKALASSFSLSAPDSIDAAHVALKTQLMSLSGRAYDSVYIKSQVQDHQTTISLFENEVNNGNNQQLINHANTLLPKLRMHKHMADSLANYYQ